MIKSCGNCLKLSVCKHDDKFFDFFYELVKPLLQQHTDKPLDKDGYPFLRDLRDVIAAYCENYESKQNSND